MLSMIKNINIENKSKGQIQINITQKVKVQEE